jgi:acyl carrier protein
MERSAIVEKLSEYLAKDVLGGRDIGLDEKTPLLEWGIINSLEMIRLLNFTHEQLMVDIPADQLIASHFTNISTIADLILEQKQAQEGISRIG